MDTADIVQMIIKAGNSIAAILSDERAGCDEHFALEWYPCPWPGCSRGIQSDSFVGYAYGETPIALERRSWDDPDGEKYFTWAPRNAPVWFTLPQDAERQMMRRGYVVRRPPLVRVYHYTSLEGLAGIIREKGLWLTHYSFLADPREMEYGRELVLEVLEREAGAGPAEFYQRLRAALEDMPEVYIVSFSANGDALEQWRAYGAVAVGFEFSGFQVAPNMAFDSVCYDRDLQIQRLRVLLRHAAQGYSFDSKLEKGPELAAAMYPDAVANHLLMTSAFFKLPHYSSESESRLVLWDARIRGWPSLDRTKLSYRCGRGGLIPYYKSHDILNAAPKLVDVVVGPATGPLAVAGVKHLLSWAGLGHVDVHTSSILSR